MQLDNLNKSSFWTKIDPMTLGLVANHFFNSEELIEIDAKVEKLENLKKHLKQMRFWEYGLLKKEFCNILIIL